MQKKKKLFNNKKNVLKAVTVNTQHFKGTVYVKIVYVCD